MENFINTNSGIGNSLVDSFGINMSTVSANHHTTFPYNPTLPPTLLSTLYSTKYSNLYPSQYPALLSNQQPTSPTALQGNHSESVYPTPPTRPLASYPAMPRTVSSHEHHLTWSAPAQSQHALYKEACVICNGPHYPSTDANENNSSAVVPFYFPASVVVEPPRNNATTHHAVATGYRVRQPPSGDNAVTSSPSDVTIIDVVGVESLPDIGVPGALTTDATLIGTTNAVAFRPYECNPGDSFVGLRATRSGANEVVSGETASPRNSIRTGASPATVDPSTAPKRDTQRRYPERAREVLGPPIVVYIDLTSSDDEDVEVPRKGDPQQIESESKEQNEGSLRMNIGTKDTRSLVPTTPTDSTLNSIGSRLRQLRRTKKNKETDNMEASHKRVSKMTRKEKSQEDTKSLKLIRGKVSAGIGKSSYTVKKNKNAKKTPKYGLGKVRGEEINSYAENNVVPKRSTENRYEPQREAEEVNGLNVQSIYGQLVTAPSDNEIASSNGEGTLSQVNDDHLHNEIRKVRECTRKQSSMKLN